MTKIFGIGLPRTGTMSLHNAAKLLGLRSIHFPHDDETVRQIRRGDYRLTILDSCDMVSDVPIPAIFPQLDRAFPGSKFILTYRDCESWIRSHEQVGFNQRPPSPGTTRDFYRALLYGVTEYSEERFRWVYEDHHARVRRYFEGRESDLLVLDVVSGNGWEELCPFLDKPIPDVPFPHSNRSIGKVDVIEQPSMFGRLARFLRVTLGGRGGAPRY